MKLTGIIIAKNAEDLIKDAIESISICDEVLVVDNNSSDATGKVATSLGAKVISVDTKSFAESRNIGLKHAKGEWILYIDTDERVSDALKRSMQEAIISNKYSAYKLQRKNFYFGNHEWPKIEQLERLFLKSKLKKWYGDVHETAEIEGSVGLLNGYLYHYTHRDLSSMLKKTISWSQIEASLRYDAHHPKIVSWRLVRVTITGFWNSYILQGGWKAGTAGFIESMYQAYSMFITYATLWEMQQKK